MVDLIPGAAHTFAWQIPDMGGQPIAEVGVELNSAQRADGTVYLDYMTWDGAPAVTFHRPVEKGDLWRRVWVDGTDHYDRWWPEAYRVVVNYGTGLLITGTREWADYRVSSTLTPHMCQRFGVAARVQGMKRYYALLLCADGKARLIKALGGETVLAEVNRACEFGQPYDFALQMSGARIRGWIDGTLIADVQDDALAGGGIALVCTEGRVGADAVSVEPSH
jgi:hypothetical protein